jgi:hypothetical protein
MIGDSQVRECTAIDEYAKARRAKSGLLHTSGLWLLRSVLKVIKFPASFEKSSELVFDTH